MRSTFGGLNTVVRGIYANQMSLDTVGHNIANADTDGFSRQRVNLVSTTPQTIYSGNGKVQLGTGVATQSITRIRDTFVDQQMWKEKSTLGYGETIYSTLSKVEGVFQEPTETGIQTVLDNYWKAWNTVATNASDNGARVALRERGVELVDAIQQANTQLRAMAADINAVIGIRVDTVNQITAEMLSLNKQIAGIEVGGLDHANDLRDRRDYLVDQLAQIVNVRVTEDKAGNYIVQSSGLVLVDGNERSKLQTKSHVDPDYGYEVVDVVDASTQLTVNFTSGELKGLIDARDKTANSSQGEARESDIGIKAYLNKLSQISQFLLQDFNAAHRSGYGMDDSTGNNFFGAGGEPDPNYSASDLTSIFGVAAAADVPKYKWIEQLQVNPDFFTSNGVEKIAAKAAATQGNAAGDNAVLMANKLKVDTSGILGNASLDSFYGSFIGALGVQTQNAERLTDNQQTLVNTITNWRESVCGVNLDEEMSNMIRFQKGYNAAARVLTTMDEMLDKLINGTGVVGR
ncbi:flagellar hook-associated protein FlgK [Sporomusa termitida]|uniref:Flagellar hook-associated protein 1 n=1 Tax=Sporomusa termitida TaxID=2377 RepID=A0A517DX88_9FIRM|nr:flagellar hook-associated protein FlgK [Sporomusa termitida]QDR81968.1 flagellar hook-associated protein FlgK [Sporomusa termitida]